MNVIGVLNDVHAKYEITLITKETNDEEKK